MKTLSSLLASRSWHYSFGFRADLDFCFWILERDGLQVPPFDQHPDGDGALRAAGLDAASWWAWLERAIAARQERHEILNACDAQLWRNLAPYRRRLPPIQIAAIGYPGPVQAVVPPETILLAVGKWRPTPAELSAAILEGMQLLAKAA